MADRRTAYSEAFIPDIAKAIRDGLSNEDAATLVGIGVSTFYKWMKAHIELREAVQKAHAEFKRANVTSIRAAGIKVNNGQLEGSWQANAWLLERKYPNEFGQKLTLRVTPEQAAVLARHGLSISDAFEQMIQEIANLDQSGGSDASRR